jgi:hypothetical protein
VTTGRAHATRKDSKTTGRSTRVLDSGCSRCSKRSFQKCRGSARKIYHAAPRKCPVFAVIGRQNHKAAQILSCGAHHAKQGRISFPGCPKAFPPARCCRLQLWKETRFEATRSDTTVDTLVPGVVANQVSSGGFAVFNNLENKWTIRVADRDTRPNSLTLHHPARRRPGRSA